jgi:uncharacterized protein
MHRVLALSALVVLAGCSRTPAEPAPAASTRSAATIVVPPPTAMSPVVASPSASSPASGACPPDPERAPPLPTAPVSFDSGARLTVELARTPRETERGLMYRRSMPEDRGMLFRLGERDDHAFWMRNTCIPLDMLFIDADGTIVGVLEDVPILNEDPRSVGRPSTHVLEANAGWARRHGVREGQKLLLPAAAK